MSRPLQRKWYRPESREEKPARLNGVAARGSPTALLQTIITRILLILMFTVVARAEHIEFSGFTEDTTHWSTDTVFVNGNVTATMGEPRPKQLIIDPGVVVFFTGPYKIRFYEGNYTIRAAGTGKDSIRFTAPDSVRWKGLQIDRRDDYVRTGNEVVFSYCIFERCTGDAIKFVGMDSLTTASLTHNRFTGIDSGSALSFYAPGSGRRFFRTTIAHNRFIGGTSRFGGCGLNIFNTAYSIRFPDTLPVTQIVENNLFYGNHAQSGGAIQIEGDRLLLRNNRFENNSADLEGGAIYLKISPSIVENNTFVNNSVPFDAEGEHKPGTDGGGAIMIMMGGDTTNAALLSGNLFAGNRGSNGGAIHCNNASVLLVNNTICNNTAAYGSGLYWESSYGTQKCVNTIFWGNRTVVDTGAQFYLWWARPEFHHCVVEGGVSTIWQDSLFVEEGNYKRPFEQCLNGYPNFVDTANGDFHLLKTSGCVNGGTPDTSGLHLAAVDLDSAGRILGDTVDIGCYEYITASAVYQHSAPVPGGVHRNTDTKLMYMKSVRFFPATGTMYTLMGRRMHGTYSDNIPVGCYIIAAPRGVQVP